MAVYKDKERGTWYTSISFRDNDGELKTKKKRGFELKRDAESWERKFKIEHSTTGIYTTFKFEDMAELYFKSREGFASKYTLETKKQRVRDYCTELLKLTMPISSKRLQQWRVNLGSNTLSTTTKNTIIATLKSIIMYSYLTYDLDDTAKALPTFKRTFEEMKERRVLTIENFNKFIKCVDNDVYKLFFEFCYYTGCRKSEAKAITKDDIDLKYKTVTINKSIQHREKGNRAMIAPLKTPKSYRLLKLDNKLFNDLISLVEQEGPYIFGGFEPLSNSSIDRYLRKGFAKAKVVPITLHEFRHSYGSILLDHDIPLIAVSKLLGHSSIDVTSKVYAHSMRNIDERGAKLFNKLRSKNKL